MAFYKYLIQYPYDLNKLIKHLEEVDIFAFDIETNGKFGRDEMSLVGISFGFDTFACYVPLNHHKGVQLPAYDTLEKFKPVFEDPNSHYVAHNSKFDETVLSLYDIDCKGICDDTYVMAWLLAEDADSKGLKPLVQSNLGISMTTYEEIMKKASRRKRAYDFAEVKLSSALEYASADAYFTLELYNIFKPQILKQKLWPAYEKIERPFQRVLRYVETAGVNIDIDYLQRADRDLPRLAETVEAQIYKEAGEVFNIGSGQQLGKVLFEKLGIGKNVPKTPSGNYSTDKKTLTTYSARYQIVENVLRRKKIQKTHSTFVVGLRDAIERDGRIHTSFNGCGTVTGRLSSRNPNLQNIEGDEVEEVKIRDFFIPNPDNVFVVSDYEQIELRVMAHFSKDKNMIEAFKSGRDFHEETAVRMLGVEDVDRKSRLIAKTLNFGVGYGRGPVGIAEQLGCSMEEAKAFIADYFTTFSGLALYKKWLLGQARKHGYIRTLSGRKRRVPLIRSDDWKLRGNAERQAFNTKCQGSAADLIKASMLSLQSELQKLNASIILQVHDELVVETKKEYAEDVKEIVKGKMEQPVNGKNPLRLPLVTHPVIVEKWGKAK